MPLVLKQIMADFWPVKDPVLHSWDDWDPYPALGSRSDETEFLLMSISDRAKLAYTIGCAAWVASRFSPSNIVDEAWQYLDAAWLCQVSDQVVVPEAPEDHPRWHGEIGGPIHLALITVENCFAGLEEENAIIDASFAELVGCHVTPNRQTFLAWSARLLEKLKVVSPPSPDGGLPVSPWVLGGAPGEKPLPTSLKSDIERFTALVRATPNPFVRAAESADEPEKF